MREGQHRNFTEICEVRKSTRKFTEVQLISNSDHSWCQIVILNFTRTQQLLNIINIKTLLLFGNTCAYRPIDLLLLDVILLNGFVCSLAQTVDIGFVDYNKVLNARVRIVFNKFSVFIVHLDTLGCDLGHVSLSRLETSICGHSTDQTP